MVVNFVFVNNYKTMVNLLKYGKIQLVYRSNKFIRKTTNLPKVVIKYMKDENVNW